MRGVLSGMMALVTAGCATAPEPVALAEGEGLVTLECFIQASGQLSDCKVLSEQPPGMGFGETALRAASQTRLEPDITRRKIRWTLRYDPESPVTLDLTPPRA